MDNTVIQSFVCILFNQDLCRCPVLSTALCLSALGPIRILSAGPTAACIRPGVISRWNPNETEMQWLMAL